MKCPRCEYKNGWDDDKMDVIEGKYGSFYNPSNDIRAIRNEDSIYMDAETRSIYFCPSCGSSFIEV